MLVVVVAVAIPVGWKSLASGPVFIGPGTVPGIISVDDGPDALIVWTAPGWPPAIGPGIV